MRTPAENLNVCRGFFLGGFIGANITTALSSPVLEKVFGIAVLLISLKMIFAQ